MIPDGARDARAVVSAVEATAERRRSRGGGMAWRIWGAGPPVVLLHGASGSWTHWIRNVQTMATRRTVFVPDMPGFGDSEPVPEPHTADALADLVVAGIEETAPATIPFDLVGFSFGGVIAGLVAARLGHRVRALVLIGAGALGLPDAPLPSLVRADASMTPEQIREAHRENLRRLMFGDPQAVDDLAVVLQMENLRRAQFRSGRIPVSDVLVRALPAIRARLTGIWAARDAYVGPYVEERRRLLAAYQPDLDFRVIDGAGHWVIYEAAEAVNAALLNMLIDDPHRARP